MGIEALYVKPRLSLAHPGHVKYPCLLRGLEITRANHVWAADITYIPMANGLSSYFKFYNERRWHNNFDRKTPAMVYFGTELQKQAAA